jgi:hypothetical protein
LWSARRETASRYPRTGLWRRSWPLNEDQSGISRRPYSDFGAIGLQWVTWGTRVLFK